jgi:hypothetical protein
MGIRLREANAMSLYEKYLPKVPCVYEKRWAKINAFGDTRPMRGEQTTNCGADTIDQKHPDLPLRGEGQPVRRPQHRINRRGRHGLDHARSWIVIAKGNEFVWLGYDLRKAPKADSFGFLPPRLFNQVRDAFVAFHKAGQTKTRSRA